MTSCIRPIVRTVSNTDSVSVSDRVYNYGDGVFTTMLSTRGDIQCWPEHKARLIRGMQCLGITELTSWVEVEQQLSRLVSDFPCVVKLQISRGSGGRGYSPLGIPSPEIILKQSAYPEHYTVWRDQGIRLGVSDIHLGVQPLLAGIKHCNRIEQVLIRAGLDVDEQSDDHLVLDINKHVVETSAANIFWFIGGSWCTTSLETSGVAGVMREVLIHQVLSQQVQIKSSVELQELASASSIFICNSLMHIVPVVRFMDKAFDVEHVRQVQQQLALYFEGKK